MLRDMYCKHCGENVNRLILLAMMEEAGAKCYPSSTHCTKETEHEFVQLEAEALKNGTDV